MKERKLIEIWWQLQNMNETVHTVLASNTMKSNSNTSFNWMLFQSVSQQEYHFFVIHMSVQIYKGKKKQNSISFVILPVCHLFIPLFHL